MHGETLKLSTVINPMMCICW